MFTEPFKLLTSKVRSPSHFLRSPRSNLPLSIQEFGEDQRGRGEMNCGNLGEGCRRRDFPRDTNNIYCLTSIKFLKQDVQQSNQIMTEKKINIHCSWSNKFNIWWIHATAATFLTKIYIAAFVFEFCKSALTHWLLCRLWRALAFHFWRHHFGPKLASSVLNFCRWKRSFQ